MGRALIGGLLRAGWVSPSELAVTEPNEDARAELDGRYPGVECRAEAVAAPAAVLAVKPADAEAGARTVAASGARRVVSIVAGLRAAQLQEWVGDGVAVIRAMPNMPAVLGAGATAVAGAPSVSEEDFAWAEAVLSSFGVVARVPEKLLDAVTGLSGSGPAYLFLLAEAMIDAGVEQGIDREVSRLLVNHTLLGAARMLVETGDGPQVLRAAVTSPGGTTSAGLRALERHAVRAAVLEAVSAATARSRRLGRVGKPARRSGEADEASG